METEILDVLQQILVEMRKLTQDIKPKPLKCPDKLTGKEREKWFRTVMYAPEMTYTQGIERLSSVWKGKKQNWKSLAETYKNVDAVEAERLGRRECYWMGKLDLAYFEDGFYIPEELDD